MRYTLTIFFVCMFLTASSTCIVVFKLGKYIYIAADSRRTIRSVDPSHNLNEIDTICKVFKRDKYWFAFAGSDNIGFEKDISVVIKKNSNTIEFLKLLQKQMVSRYEKAMLQVRQLNGNIYNEYLRDGLGQVLVMYFDGSVPKIAYITFTLSDVNKKPTVKANIEIDIPKQAIGFTDHIVSLTDEEFNKIMDQTIGIGKPELFGQRLIEIEIPKHQNNIGKPIDLIRLSAADGETWLSPKRKCN